MSTEKNLADKQHIDEESFKFCQQKVDLFPIFWIWEIKFERFSPTKKINKIHKKAIIYVFSVSTQ